MDKLEVIVKNKIFILYLISNIFCEVFHRDFFCFFLFFGVAGGLGVAFADGIFFFMFSAGFLKTKLVSSLVILHVALKVLIQKHE